MKKPFNVDLRNGYTISVIEDPNADNVHGMYTPEVTRLWLWVEGRQIGDLDRPDQVLNHKEVAELMNFRGLPLVAIRGVYQNDAGDLSLMKHELIGPSVHIGWAFVTYDQANRSEVMFRKAEWAAQMMESDVRTYSEDLKALKYGFQLKRSKGGSEEVVQQAWGFPGMTRALDAGYLAADELVRFSFANVAASIKEMALNLAGSLLRPLHH